MDQQDTSDLPIDASNEETNEAATEFGKLLFQWRDYTPIPLIILLLLFAKPSALSATVGLFLVGCGELLRIYSVAFIGSVSRTRSDSTGDQVISSGPFAYVRNPLYVGNFLICMGIAIFGGRAWITILTAALFAFQYYYIVKYEESLLLKRFGEQYREFCANVPPWIPRKKFSFDKIDWPDTFIPALRSEKRTLTAIVAILVVLLLASCAQLKSF